MTDFINIIYFYYFIFLFNSLLNIQFLSYMFIKSWENVFNIFFGENFFRLFILNTMFISTLILVFLGRKGFSTVISYHYFTTSATIIIVIIVIILYCL